MAAKLPRRTMSMAKRAVKLAEDASEIDAIEAIAGAPTGEKIGAFQFVGAWIAGVGGLVLIIAALGFACNVTTAKPDWSPPGAQSREAVGEAFYREGDPTDGRMGSGRDSPFPNAQQEDPIILEVVCPPGTVHISTGATAADSVCVKGELAGMPASPTATATASPTATPDASPPYSLPDTGSR